jgi:phosphopantetheinyl transferase (holo-ACP synthase)
MSTSEAQLRGELKALLPPSISSAVIPLADHSEALFASERPLIAHASEPRIESFSSGRLAARMALAGAMGDDAPGPILSNFGAPVPPRGWRLSISHCDHFAAAAACRAHEASGLGIDLERVGRMDLAWRSHVIQANDRIARSAGVLELTIVFSLKESLFKALAGAGEGRLVGDMSICWDDLTGDPQLEWAATAPAGRPEVRWGMRKLDEHVLTFCLLDARG